MSEKVTLDNTKLLERAKEIWAQLLEDWRARKIALPHSIPARPNYDADYIFDELFDRFQASFTTIKEVQIVKGIKLKT